MNPYHVLGAPPDADVETLRALYRQLVRQHHPDRALDEAARAVSSARMVMVNQAWHIVSDPQRRAAYDSSARLAQFESAHRQREAAQRATAQREAAQRATAQREAAQRATAQREGRQQSADQRTTPQREARGPKGRHGAALEREMRARAAAQIRERERQKFEAAGRPAPAKKRLTREEKKQAAQARAHLRQMRREDKKRGSSPTARRQLAEAARLFAQEGRASEAIAICHDVLRVDGRNVPARELLGDFYLRLGRQDRALPLWEQALMLQPENAALRRKFNALHPHNPTHYDPQPRIPHAPAAGARPANAKRSGAAPTSLWNRLRAKLSG